MLGEVEIAAGGDAFQFLAGEFAIGVAFAEGEFVEDIHGGAGVMGEFLRLLPVFDEAGARQADVFVKAEAFLDPILVPDLPAPIGLGLAGMAGTSRLGNMAADGFDRLVGADEELEFHLLEFAGSEGEVAGVDFVAEGLADLADAEGDFLARDFEDVLELGEDGLGGFGPQPGEVLGAFHRADISFEHQVELARFGEEAAVFGVVAGGVFNFLGALAEQMWIYNSALLVKLLGYFSRVFRVLS